MNIMQHLKELQHSEPTLDKCYILELDAVLKIEIKVHKIPFFTLRIWNMLIKFCAINSKPYNLF